MRRGGVIVYNQKDMIIEIEALLKSVETYKDDSNMYVELMKQRILSVSGDN